MFFWTLIGWLGNACFFSRFIVQWWVSERARRSAAPPLFWWLSLLGAACLFGYTIARGEPVLVCGHLVNSAIYTRNLWIGSGQGRGRGLRGGTVVLIALLVGAALLAVGVLQPRPDLVSAPFWLACSIAGQGIWSTRFLIQWAATERRQDSHFPPSFWWVSLAGNSLLLAYCLHLGDPVLVAGYLLGPIVQVRNLMLEHRRRAEAYGEAESAGSLGSGSCPPVPGRRSSR